MCVHLFAMINEFVIQAKTRVLMLWSSFIFMLHIDGVHHATTKNWLVATISLSFLVLRDDVVCPHITTSEPSKHSIARICSFKR